MNTADNIAKNLLKINAIRFNFDNLFTWASGWRSPVYCDNRCSLAYPAVRRLICDAFVDVIRQKYPDVEIIAGVATGAIAHGMLVAEKLELPFVYVRDKAKDHGLKKMVEGISTTNKKVVIIEDLISTGGSSLKVFENLRAEGADVLGMIAIFTYEFDIAKENFKDKCELTTLSTYGKLIEQALSDGYIKETDVALLRKWRDAPDKFPELG
jgi:orotate phosphoribosyltransferase